jgi:hypothetical protein
MGVDRLVALVDFAPSKQSAIANLAEFIPSALAKILQ